MVLSVVLLLTSVVLTVSLLVDPLHPWFQSADDWWMDLVAAHRNAPLTSLAKVLNLVGSTVITLPLRIAALVVLVLRRRWTQMAAFLTAIVLSELCIGPLKAIVDRPRPPVRLVETTGASFPSGHAIAASVTAFGLVIAFLPRGRRRLHWIIVSAVVAGSMAWSRTYLGAHWATDTIAGICIGTGLAVGIDVLLEQLRTDVATVPKQSRSSAERPAGPSGRGSRGHDG
jgi:undecaprenyl-diphosphatase